VPLHSSFFSATVGFRDQPLFETAVAAKLSHCQLLIAPGIAPIAAKIADIATPIDHITSQIAAVAANLARIGPDFTPIRRQFCSRSIVAPVLSIFT